MLRAANPKERPVNDDFGARVEFLVVAIAVFLTPFNYFRLSAVYLTLGDLFLFLAFAIMLFRKQIPLRPFGAATELWFASLTVFLLGILVSSVVNGDMLEASTVMAQYLVSLVIFPAVILRRSSREVELLVLVFVVSIAVTMMHGAYYVNFVEGPNPFVSGNGRLIGLVERANEAGDLAAFSLVFLIWLREKGTVSVVAFVLLFFVLSYGLLLTGSSSAFLLAAIGMSVTLVVSQSSMTRQFFLLFAVFAIALILWKFFLPDIFFKRVFEPAMRGNISDTGTFDDRLFLIKEAIRLANQTVWLGFGVEQHASHSVLGASVHNVYLLTLTEGGILSLLGLAGFFCASLFVVWSGYVFYGRSEDTAVSLVLVLMVFLVFSAITYFYARFWALPWMLGLSASLSRDLTAFQAHKASPRPERLRAALRRPS